MKYYLGNNGLEYQTPEDAEKYGEGLKGYRETTTEIKAVTYTEMTGQPVPESPVDHVIATPAYVPPAKEPEVIQTPTGPVEVKDLSPTEPPVPVTPAEVIEIKEAVKEEIVMQEIPKGVEIVDWNSKTDADLKAMCKEKRVRGYAFMKRENMIKRLS